MIDTAIVKVCRLDPRARLPSCAFDGDLCADLYSLSPHSIEPMSIVCVPTGIAIELEPGFGAMVEDRSGLALRGVVTLGGVIDSGYRGEIRVIVANFGKELFAITPGDRIAQIRVVRRYALEFREVESLAESSRGSAGYGSTGMK